MRHSNPNSNQGRAATSCIDFHHQALRGEGMSMKLDIARFEDEQLTTIMYKGEPVWVATEVGRILGYAKSGRRLITTLNGEWKDEFVEGDDYVVLRGQELASFKQLISKVVSEPDPSDGSRRQPDPSVVGSRASHLLLLTEQGLHGVLLLSQKEIGRRLRRFLRKEVLPKLARGEAIPGRNEPEQVESNVVDFRLLEHQLQMQKELRLSRALDLKISRFESEQLRKLMEYCPEGPARQSLMVVATEAALRRPLPGLLPQFGTKAAVPTADTKPGKADTAEPSEAVVAEFPPMRAGDISKLVGGQLSGSMIGRIRKELGLEGTIEGLCVAVLDTARGGKQVTNTMYLPAGAQRIVDRAVEMGRLTEPVSVVELLQAQREAKVEPGQRSLFLCQPGNTNEEMAPGELG